jgi:aristolochene synthase
MDFAQMLSYRERVMNIALGMASPDRDLCLEWMLHDTFQDMRNIDEVQANDVAQGFCQLLQAQTSQERISIQTLGSYLSFREVDAGRPYVSPRYDFESSYIFPELKVSEQILHSSH